MRSYLRCHIVNCPHQIRRIHMGCSTKIAYFQYLIILKQKQVLRFEIAMNNFGIHVVNVRHSLERESVNDSIYQIYKLFYSTLAH